MSKQGSVTFQTKNSLNSLFGNGNNVTKKTYTARIRAMASRIKIEHGIKALKEIDNSILEQNAIYLDSRVCEGTLSLNTAYNYISAFNSVMCGINGDKRVYAAPSSYLETRNPVRKTPPPGCDLIQVQCAAQAIRNNGHQIFGDFTEIIRDAALRHQEVVSQNYQRIMKTLDGNIIHIVEGSKGAVAKHCERKVKVGQRTLDIISNLADKQASKNNLIPDNLLRIQYMQQYSRQWCRVRSDYYLIRIHDLRAAAACDWYFKLTGVLAPVLGGRITDLELDHDARLLISKMMGHHRPEITDIYIGKTQ